jgi:hypothetical protein
MGTILICMGHIPVHGTQHILYSVGHMGMGMGVEHDDIPCQHEGMLQHVSSPAQRMVDCWCIVHLPQPRDQLLHERVSFEQFLYFH